MNIKTKIVAAAFVMAAAASPALASDSTFEQFYANSGQPFTYLGTAPSPVGYGAQDAFAQANGEVRNNQPRFEVLGAKEPVSLQVQRWYDRQSEIY